MFKPTPNPPRKISPMFSISADLNNETLLVHSCESLASATVMINDFATLLDRPYRNTALGIAQVILSAEMAVNQALDNLDPQD